MLRINRQKGVVTLMLTIVILMVVTLTTLYTSRVVVTDDKVFANTYRNNQALDAARSGFDYALAYLIENASTVTTGGQPDALDNCLSLYSAPLAAPGPLANGSTYTMTYGCVTAGSTTYLTITAVGTSADGSATKTVSATVRSLTTSSATPIVAGSAVTTNVGTVTNSLPGATYAIDSGSTVMNTGTLVPNASNENNGALVLTPTEFITGYMGNLFSFFSTYAAAPYARFSCTGSVTFNNQMTYRTSGNPAATRFPAACASSLVTSFSVATPVLNNPAGGVLYIQMPSGSTLTFQNSNASAYVLGTAGSAATRAIVVADFASGGSFVVEATNTGNADVINGNIYTNAATLEVRRNGTSNATSLTINGLIVSAATGSTAIVNNNTTGTGLMSVQGEVASAGGVVISNTTTGTAPSVTLSSASLGYISGSHAGLVGPAAYNGISGSSASAVYGLVAGSLKDF